MELTLRPPHAPDACDHVGMSGVTRQSAGSHHLYVHVPFCRLVCAYCDFVTVGGRGDAIPRYVAALHAELAAAAIARTPGDHLLRRRHAIAAAGLARLTA